jgi:TP901 family phage tail tape measure protein
MSKSSAANAAAAANMQQNLINNVNATGKFNASIKTVKTTTESFTTALEKNKLSLGQYFKYSVASSKSFGRVFKNEFDTINKVARERVKDLQTQYIKLGRDANGAMKAIAVRPLALDMENLGTKTAIAAQRQQLLNQMLKQGSTNLLNFGKNTQWAGRQLMVGFTIPIGMAGAAAAKAYMEIEKASVKIRRVYGDLSTTTQETNDMVTQIKTLAAEYTKYGIAVADTMEMAATAAAMGKTGADLLAQVASASKLAALGGVDQGKALETTISITDAFGISADKLSKKINFLNAVENQTVTSIEDLTIAVPKAGPVIQQLGGDVEDLAFLLTAMREGGINASEGANALKSGLAALINPTGKAVEMLKSYGINVQEIVNSNKGDVKKTVTEFAAALDTLDPLNRARAIEQMFGKFQFARLSTLFQNVNKEGSQASKALELANMSAIQLAAISARELEKLESSPMYKFQKALADLQTNIAPVGETFLKAVTPIVEFVSKILVGFNGMSDGFKQFSVISIGVVGGLAPVLLMLVGLVANGAANIIKLFANIKSFFNGAASATNVLGEQVGYMTQEQLNAAAVAASLDQTHSKLIQTFTSEASAVRIYANELRRANSAAAAFNVPGVSRVRPAKKMAGGGMVTGPGGPKDDLVPTDLSNGEAVIDAATVKKNPRIISALFAGKKIQIPGYAKTNKGQFRFLGSAGFFNRQSVNSEAGNPAKDAMGAKVSDLVGDWQRGGAGAASPLMVALAKKMGISLKGLENNPELIADFTQAGEAIIKTASDAMVASGKEFVKDSDIEDAVVPALKSAAKGIKLGGKNVSAALDSVLEDFNVVTMKGIKGGTRQTGPESSSRARIPGSDNYITQRPLSQKLAKALNPDVFGTMSIPSNSKPGTMKNWFSMLNPFGQKEKAQVSHIQTDRPGTWEDVQRKSGTGIDKVTRALGPNAVAKAIEVEQKGMIDAAKKKADIASPSKEAKEVGEDLAQGFLDGANSKAKEAKKAGLKVASSVPVISTQSGTDSMMRELELKKANLEMMGLNTSAIDKEIAERKKFNATVRESIALETKQTSSKIVANQATLAYNQQGPLAPGQKRLTRTQTVMGGIKNAKVGDLAGAGGKLAGLGAAASMATFALSGMGGTVGQIASAILPAISIFSILSPLLSTFGVSLGIANLPLLPIALGFAAIAAVIGVSAFLINKANEERKKEVARIQASSEAHKSFNDVANELASLAGGEVKRTFNTGTATQITDTGATGTQISDIDTLLKSDKFTDPENPIAQLVELLKTDGLDTAEATAYLSSQAQTLFGAGISEPDVDTLIKAVQVAAGRKDLNLDFKSININNPNNIKSITKNLKTFDEAISKNRKFTKKVTEYIPNYGGGAPTAVTVNKVDENMKAAYDDALDSKVAMAKENIASFNDQFSNGLIDAKTYNNAIDAVKKSIAEMDSVAQETVISEIFADQDQGIKDIAGSFTNATNKVLLYQATTILGSENVKASLADIPATIDSITNATTKAAAVEAYRVNILKTTVAEQMELLKTQLAAAGVVVPDSGSNSGGSTKKTPLQDLQDQLKAAQALKTLLSSGVSSGISDMLSDLSAGDRAKYFAKGKLTSKGVELKNTYNTKVLADFGNEQTKLTRGFAEEKNAKDALVSSGLNYIAAVKASTDADVRAAIVAAQSLPTAAKRKAALDAIAKALGMVDEAQKKNSWQQQKDSQVSATNSAIDQANAYKKLVNAGMSASAAYDAVQDAALAASIAQAASTDEIKSYINAARTLLVLAEKLKSPDQRIIDNAQKQIDVYQAEANTYQDAISILESKEQDINKTYEDRVAALDKVLAAQQAISEEQQGQLDLASALSRGDMAAAAKSAADIRAKAASTAIDTQKRLLTEAKDAQVKALSVMVGSQTLTMKDLTDKVAALQLKITGIELNTIDPAAQRIANDAQANIVTDAEINAAPTTFTAPGKTAAEIAAEKAAADKAAADKAAADKAAKAKAEADAKKKVVTTPQKKVNPAYTTAMATKEKLQKSLSDMDARIREINGKISSINNNYDQQRIKFGERNAQIAPLNSELSNIANSKRLTGQALAQLKIPAQYLASGGMVGPGYFARGGMARGTDIIPAMLTPGEFVIKKSSVEGFGAKNLKSINEGTYSGDSVYNYSINVNAGTNASTDDIARAVMAKIKQVDSQRIRGNTF